MRRATSSSVRWARSASSATALLTVYDEAGKLLFKGETGLNDITGVAYSPKTASSTRPTSRGSTPSKAACLTLAANGDKVKAAQGARGSTSRPLSRVQPRRRLYVTVIGSTDDATASPAN